MERKHKTERENFSKSLCGKKLAGGDHAWRWENVTCKACLKFSEVVPVTKAKPKAKAKKKKAKAKRRKAA